MRAHDRSRWGGYLVPAEVLALVRVGLTTSSDPDWHIGWAREKVAKGQGGGCWFYFYPGSELMKLLPVQDTVAYNKEVQENIHRRDMVERIRELRSRWGGTG